MRTLKANSKLLIVVNMLHILSPGFISFITSSLYFLTPFSRFIHSRWICEGIWGQLTGKGVGFKARAEKP